MSEEDPIEQELGPSADESPRRRVAASPRRSSRAIFLDRDGTLNEEVGYITDPSQFRLYDFAAEAVRRINQAGRLAIVLTNQSGIARGLYDEAFLGEVHAGMQAALARADARIDGIYYCPHHPEIGAPPYRQPCDCRKPKPSKTACSSMSWMSRVRPSRGLTSLLGEHARQSGIRHGSHFSRF